PTGSLAGSASWPIRSATPKTNSTVAYIPSDTPASPRSARARVSLLMKARSATSAMVSRRRRRATERSCPSFFRARTTGPGREAMAREDFIIFWSLYDSCDRSVGSADRKHLEMSRARTRARSPNLSQDPARQHEQGAGIAGPHPEVTGQAGQVRAGESLRARDVHVADFHQDPARQGLVIDQHHQLEVLVVLQAAVVEVGRAVDGEALV